MAKLEAITVPKWGLTMTEATVNQWLVEEGTTIGVGDDIVDMETSKITNTVESTVAGKLCRIVAQPGDTLDVAALLGVVADADVTDGEIDSFVANYIADNVASTEVVATSPASSATEQHSAAQQSSATITRPQTAASTAALTALADGADDSHIAASNHARRLALQYNVNLNNVSAGGRHSRVSRADVVAAIIAAGGKVAEPESAQRPKASTQSTADDSTVKATPVARRRAKELGINLHDCRASGARGRVCKADVDAAQRLLNSASEAAATPLAGVQHTTATESVPMTAMRRTIAERMQASKQQAPHFRVTVDVELDRLLSLCAQINSDNISVKVSINDCLIKACAMALMKVPDINIQYDTATRTIRRFSDADIAVVVAIDNGVITPIVTAANRKGLIEISNTMRELATCAKANTLTPEQFQGGSFSISNLGMYGVKQFDAIINPPQGAILAVGKGEQRAVVKEGELTAATVMTLSLSADHRVIDGALAAAFLQALKTFIEQPALMIS